MNWSIGNYIFGFFGAICRWIFYQIKNLFSKKKLEISFINIWLSNKDSQTIDDLSNNFVNVVLGILVFVLSVDFIRRFNYYF